ncbi:hypothetical protein PIIN_08556, partial [Serendipita indica DSM 11827]
HPLKETELISVPNRPEYERWKCTLCKRLLQLGALVCLDCMSYDFCLHCVDAGQGLRHIRFRSHELVFYILDIDGFFVTSSATSPSTSAGNLDTLSTGGLVLSTGDVDDRPPPYTG